MNKILLIVCIFFISKLGFAQAINDRWLGNWTSTPYSSMNNKRWQLNVSPTMFNNCVWVGSEVRVVPRNCSAFYSGSITKSELINYLNQDINQVNSWMRSGVIPASDYQRVQADLQKTQAILGRISNDTFRVITVRNTIIDNNIWILDLDSVYQIIYGEGGAGSNFHIIEFRK
jgi:hypothetical protein